MSKYLSFQPIGYINSAKVTKFDAPHQPDPEDQTIDCIKLLDESDYYQAVLDLDSFSHIWLVWWFDKNKTWRPKVLPPRGSQKRRGVFSTRSPHRPNPIAITAVPLIKVEKNLIYIGSNDLIDGTAILDIKPYLPEVDSIPEASNGWLSEVLPDDQESYQVKLSELAVKQLLWLEDQGVHFFKRAKKLLAIDPTPHRTRRIKENSPGVYRMSCGGWRVFYEIENENKEVLIRYFKSGYPEDSLLAERSDSIVDFQAHQGFYRSWAKPQCQN